jgi:hypothetical protein
MMKLVKFMPDEKEPIPKDVYARLIQHIKDMRYGSVTAIIQDGKIVQIEKNEKERLR